MGMLSWHFVSKGNANDLFLLGGSVSCRILESNMAYRTRLILVRLLNPTGLEVSQAYYVPTMVKLWTFFVKAFRKDCLVRKVGEAKGVIPESLIDRVIIVFPGSRALQQNTNWPGFPGFSAAGRGLLLDGQMVQSMSMIQWYSRLIAQIQQIATWDG